MLITLAFVFLVCLNACTHTQDLEVLHSGVAALHQNDLIVSFFVGVRNHGNQPRRLMATMLECCENLYDNDQDCDLIDLYGGDFGLIQPGSLRNLTLIYPNLYGYNRKGYCLLNILHRSLGHSDVVEIQHRLDFDTRLSSDGVPDVLQGWYDPATLVPCETPDLDPLDHCNPVDCHLKYSGYRNFYNQKKRICQRTPVCMTDLRKDLPDIVYSPTDNTCKNLDVTITRQEIERLAQSRSRTEERMVDIRCHHGEVNPRTGLCVCEKGWTSEPFDPDSYVPGKSIYSMCTIQCMREERYKYLPAVVGLIGAMWVAFLVMCCVKSETFVGGERRGGDSQMVYYQMSVRPAKDALQMVGQGRKYASHFSTAVVKKPLVKTKKRLYLFE